MDFYPGQLSALQKIKKGCIICGGTGTGKSITALAYYYQYCGGNIHTENFTDKPNLTKLFIITTAMKRDKHEWQYELARFLLTPKVDPIVIDSWNNIKKYVGVRDAFFIFDEDRVTGSGAWVKSFYKIAKENFWFILSATPGDKWTDYIPVFIANGFYRNKTDFMNQHCAAVDRYYQPTKYYNEGLLLKHKRELLVDIPMKRKTEQHHSYVRCEYDKTAYKKLMKERWNPWTNEPMMNAAELCYCLRRCSNEDDSRIVKCLEIAEDHERLIIFYNFDYELEVLKNAGWLAGTEVAEWNGHRHDNIPGTDRWVYLVQYTAGSEGWNCTSTDTVVFYSQSYSYRSTVQAAGRIDRANTPFIDLWYYHLYSHSGIDLAIRRALDNKKEFNERRFLNG